MTNPEQDQKTTDCKILDHPSRKNDGHVVVVGGVNVDMVGFPFSTLILKDSNPGRVQISYGGVGRNIAENLVKLGIPTKLISVIGGDRYGKNLIEECKRIGLDLEDSLILKDESTSIYFAVLDNNGDMNVAISDMAIFEKMTIEFIKDKKHLIDRSKVCVIDTNIPTEVIAYLLTNCKGTDFFLDTVSTTKAMKVKDFIGYFHTIKPNKIEAEMLSGIKINDQSDLEACAKYFLHQGVKRVFITLGEDGTYYNDGIQHKHLPANYIHVVNATGAGDAFIAALVYSHYHNLNIDESARFAMAASALALSHENTINPAMSVEKVQQMMEQHS